MIVVFVPFEEAISQLKGTGPRTDPDGRDHQLVIDL